MGKRCLKQYHNHHECNFLTFSQFSNFLNLGLKYHLHRVQSPVCPLPPYLYVNSNLYLAQLVSLSLALPTKLVWTVLRLCITSQEPINRFTNQFLLLKTDIHTQISITQPIMQNKMRCLKYVNVINSSNLFFTTKRLLKDIFE